MCPPPWRVWGHRRVACQTPRPSASTKSRSTASGRESGRVSFRLPQAPEHVGVPFGFFRCGHTASALQTPGPRPGRQPPPCSSLKSNRTSLFARNLLPSPRSHHFHSECVTFRLAGGDPEPRCRAPSRYRGASEGEAGTARPAPKRG